MTTVQQRTFTCFQCKEPIILQRKTDDSGWLRFDLDGVTVHKCEKNKKQPQQQQASPTSSVPPAPAPTTTPATQQQPSTNNKDAEVRVLLLQILSRLEHLEQVVVSQHQ